MPSLVYGILACDIPRCRSERCEKSTLDGAMAREMRRVQRRSGEWASDVDLGEWLSDLGRSSWGNQDEGRRSNIGRPGEISLESGGRGAYTLPRLPQSRAESLQRDTQAHTHIPTARPSAIYLGSSFSFPHRRQQHSTFEPILAFEYPINPTIKSVY